jgi:hypothetical protein
VTPSYPLPTHIETRDESTALPNKELSPLDLDEEDSHSKPSPMPQDEPIDAAQEQAKDGTIDMILYPMVAGSISPPSLEVYWQGEPDGVGDTVPSLGQPVDIETYAGVGQEQAKINALDRILDAIMAESVSSPSPAAGLLPPFAELGDAVPYFGLPGINLAMPVPSIEVVGGWSSSVSGLPDVVDQETSEASDYASGDDLMALSEAMAACSILDDTFEIERRYPLTLSPRKRGAEDEARSSKHRRQRIDGREKTTKVHPQRHSHKSFRSIREGGNYIGSSTVEDLHDFLQLGNNHSPDERLRAEILGGSSGTIDK